MHLHAADRRRTDRRRLRDGCRIPARAARKNVDEPRSAPEIATATGGGLRPVPWRILWKTRRFEPPDPSASRTAPDGGGENSKRCEPYPRRNSVSGTSPPKPYFKYRLKILSIKSAQPDASVGPPASTPHPSDVFGPSCNPPIRRRVEPAGRFASPSILTPCRPRGERAFSTSLPQAGKSAERPAAPWRLRQRCRCASTSASRHPFPAAAALPSAVSTRV